MEFQSTVSENLIQRKEISIFLQQTKIDSIPISYSEVIDNETTILNTKIREVLEKFTNNFRFSYNEDVLKYLSKYPDMIEVMPNILQIAFKELKGAKFKLEVYHDPEIEDEYLILYARFPNYNQDIIKKIDAVGKKCINFLINKSGWLIVNTDFKTEN